MDNNKNNHYIDINSETNSNRDIYEQTEISSYSQNYQEKDNNQKIELTKKEKKLLEKREKEINKRPRRFFKSMWLVMVLVISIAVSEFMLIGMVDLLALNRDSNAKVGVTIPEDASNAEIASILKSAGVIEYDDYFKYYLDIFKSSVDFTCGEYDMPVDLDYAGVVSYLQTQSNRTDSFSITFPEGMNVTEYAQTLEDNGVCSKQDFLNECNSDKYDDDYSFIGDITNDKDRYYKLEGYLYPDTYTVYKDTKPSQIVTNMLNNFEDKVMLDNDEIDGYDEVNLSKLASEKGMTVDQVVNLASIVQAEAADVDDMKMIAGIFENRLEADPDFGFQCLSSDATVYYPYRTKDDAPAGYDSNYDTYEVKGLPAGPICNPSVDAIEAVLNPTESNYMYFAHDNNGNAYYAANETQQQINLTKIEAANG